MAVRFDLSRALLRGRYMIAVAEIEANGIPLDLERLRAIGDHWDDIVEALIADVDRDFQVYDGRSFHKDRWMAWCKANNISWPTTPRGAPELDKNTFREMAKIFPAVLPN